MKKGRNINAIATIALVVSLAGVVLIFAMQSTSQHLSVSLTPESGSGVSLIATKLPTDATTIVQKPTLAPPTPRTPIAEETRVGDWIQVPAMTTDPNAKTVHFTTYDLAGTRLVDSSQLPQLTAKKAPDLVATIKDIYLRPNGGLSLLVVSKTPSLPGEIIIHIRDGVTLQAVISPAQKSISLGNSLEIVFEGILFEGSPANAMAAEIRYSQ
jgi:hypothetical protein